MGQHDKAVPWTEKAIALNPISITWYANLGASYVFLNQDAEAEKWFRRALELEPDQTDANLYSAMMYFSQGRDAFALESARKILASSPEDGWGLLIAGTAKVLLGNLTEAETYFRQKLDATSENFNGKLSLAYVLWKSGREREARPFLSEATEAARKAMDGGSESPYDRYYLARAAAIQGQKDEAYRWLEEAIRLGWLGYRWSGRDPLLENLRGEGRFRELLAEMEAKINEQRARVKVS